MKHHKKIFSAFVAMPLVITLLIGCQSDGEVVERPEKFITIKLKEELPEILWVQLI